MRVVLVLFAYLVGSIPTGLILAKLLGVDIRQHGSGNIGATNVGRTLGKKMGMLTLVGDMAKAILPVIIMGRAVEGLEEKELWKALAGGAAFLGHLFPVYLRFQGGKGVATALGIFLVVSPLAALMGIAVFALALWRWGYVSVGSLAAAIVMPVGVWTEGRSLPLTMLAIMVSALIWYKHRGNLARLINHEEKSWKKSPDGGEGPS